MAVVAVEGDLTAQQVEVIINAANDQLEHGGGVAAAIVRAGGAEIQAESRAWVKSYGPLKNGQAAVTTGGVMPARWVVHVVGPRFREGQDNEGLLRQAVRAALDTTAGLEARSVAMPAISAGIFGYPRQEATAVIASECRRWLDAHPKVIDDIRLVGYDAATTADFQKALDRP